MEKFQRGRQRIGPDAGCVPQGVRGGYRSSGARATGHLGVGRGINRRRGADTTSWRSGPGAPASARYSHSTPRDRAVASPIIAPGLEGGAGLRARREYRRRAGHHRDWAPRAAAPRSRPRAHLPEAAVPSVGRRCRLVAPACRGWLCRSPAGRRAADPRGRRRWRTSRSGSGAPARRPRPPPVGLSISCLP
jgi:hypothetical protein